MLTPNRPIALLPQDRQIMQLTGMSEKDYRFFMRQAILHSKLRPGEPTAFFDPVSFLITLVIGIALSYVASLLAPKPKEQEQGGQLDQRTVQGQDLVNGAKYTPKTGFDSVQNVVELGSVIPLIYSNRQKIGDISYGGVRVNTNLLWSQIYSIGGGQLLRAVFLVSEASITALDPTQFAIGNNLISGYDLVQRDAGRICIYSSENGGRLKSTDYIAGINPSEDEGNAQNDSGNSGGDVFQVRGPGNAWTSNFCFAGTPSNQTTFGLYGFIGNNMPFRVNAVFRPARIVKTGNSGALQCQLDGQQDAARSKQDFVFAGRTGITQGGSLSVDDTVTLAIYASTDANRTFTATQNPASGNVMPGEVNCNDVGQAVASKQSSVDEQINLGDLYRIGSALGICTTRTPNAFVSDAANNPIGGGTSTQATFTIVRAGYVDQYTPATLVGAGGTSATASSHLMQAAEANISTEREGKVVELGFRSQMQLNISGLCNFKDGRGYAAIDDAACDTYRGQQTVNVDLVNYISGTYSTYETRYSFFRIAYRVAGSGGGYTNLAPLFGIRSTTGVAVYNYLRFEFPEARRWEIRITPISGWEIRTTGSGRATGTLEVLDPHYGSVNSVSSGGVTIRYTGETVSRSQSTFGIESFGASAVIGNGFNADDGGYMVDAWARLAEGFMYNEVTATTTQPEHRVVYVNTISENESTPNYDNMAIVGMNIRASKEISTLNQFSVYVNKGINQTSKFPEVLYDLLTNSRYGTGQVLSSAQIDQASFDAASTFTNNRLYFFDGAISNKINIRSWGSQTASNYLLDLVIRNGKFALEPVANFDGPEPITQLFTSGNILEDSFSLSFADDQDRIPPKITVVWREERETSSTVTKGLFPVLREVTVRETTTPVEAPLEKIDISDYCTSERHAIDLAKWTCLTRRLVSHSVTFKTVPTEAALDIGAVFKLGVETVTYEQPQNGAIASDGTVTSWPPLANGDYAVLLWDGKGNAIQEVTLTITNGKCSSSSAVFCLKNSISNVQTYKTQSLSFDEDGNIDVEATYYPTVDSGYSQMVDEFDDSNFEIEGQQN